MGSIRIRSALLAVVVVILVACGGGPGGGTNDPQGAVQAAMGAVSSGGFAKIADYTCAAKKGDLTSALGGANLGALTQAGINMNDLFNAMTISFANLTTKEVTKSDTAATVHVTADMTMTFDKDKMKAIMKTVLAAQGAPTDDATVDAAMTAMSAAMTQTQKLDNDLQLVNEGGKWLICG